MGWPVFGLPPWRKNFRRRDRAHLVPSRRMAAAVCRADVCYPFGREHGRHRIVRRRAFITLVGGAGRLADRCAGAAADADGFLNAQSSDRFTEQLRGFRQGPKEAGYVEGENVVIRLPALAAEPPSSRAARTSSWRGLRRSSPENGTSFSYTEQGASSPETLPNRGHCREFCE